MTRAAEEVLAAALSLSEEERVKIAAELLDSVELTDADVEAAWAAEIQERVAAARRGELEATDWRTVLDRIEREVLGR